MKTSRARFPCSLGLIDLFICFFVELQKHVKEQSDVRDHVNAKQPGISAVERVQAYAVDYAQYELYLETYDDMSIIMIRNELFR